MGHLDACDDLYFYVQDMFLGQIIYFWCFVDLVLVAVLFLFFQTLYRNHVIGTWAYTIYKVWWYLTTPVAFLLFLADVFFTMDVRFWRGIYFAIVLTFNFNIRYSLFLVVDFAQLCAKVCVLLDIVQIT